MSEPSRCAATATLLIEPFGGMAGDMLLAALLDLGRPELVLADLRALAAALVPGECELSVDEVRRGGLRALRLQVRTSESERPPERHLSDLFGLLERAPLGTRARVRAQAVLRRLAAAEARVHGCAPEEVHFHEVGAVDTLVDVAGACLALERLGVGRVLATAPYVGGGTVHCAHGELPVPAPGTAELLRGLPTRAGPGGERLTPTAAALLAELAERVGEPEEELAFVALGHGAGARDPAEGPPNLVRVRLAAAPAAEGARRTAWELAFNLDDATGEEVGFLLAELRAAGALEAWTAPVQMKKDRPGIVVHALCRAEARGALERAAFDHGPTLGVRWTRHERAECARETLEVLVLGRTVRVKRRRRPHAPDALGPHDLSPEHDDVAQVARASGRPLREIAELALAAARRALV